MAFIFIDTNVFMYAVGGDHPYREPCQKLIQKIQDGEVKAAVNTEVLQEILYRYQAINKPQIGYDLFDALLDTFAIIWPISRTELVEAKKLQQKHGVKTRDAIHAATMKANQSHRLYSYDADFDRLPFVRRLVPE